MLELSVRLLAAGLIFLISGWFRTPDFATSWVLTLFIGSYAAIGHLYESKKGRTQTLSTALAICDSASLIFLASALPTMPGLGFLGILPALYANRRLGVSLWLTAPASAVIVLVADAMNGAGTLHPSSCGLAIAFVTLAYLLRTGKTANSQPIPIVPRSLEVNIEAEQFLILRENFRKVKDRYHELEIPSKKDHALAALFSCRIPGGPNFHTKLAEKIAELSGADSVGLYMLSQFGGRMVVRATAGNNYPGIDDSSYSIDLNLAARQVTDKIELATRAMLSETDRAKVATVLLTYESQVVGMVNLFHTEWDCLYEAKRMVEDLASVISWVVVDQQRKFQVEKRIQELEILYETAAVSTGATGRVDLADRITRRLAGVISADFVGTYLMERGLPRLVSHCGVEVPCLECMSFMGGSGFEGWISAGAPELAIYQPSEDQRCNVDQLLRKRIGGFLLVPLRFSEAPFGFMVAASRSSGALEAADLATLRSISCEFAQAVCRLEMPSGSASGLVTPSVLQNLAGGQKPGCLVYFELLKSQQFRELCEAGAIREGLRAFSLRLRGKLTAGGAACQKPGGDFVAFLPNTPADFASNWANEVAATASMIGIATSSGKRTMPLAFRARVAELSNQRNEAVISGTDQSTLAEI